MGMCVGMAVVMRVGMIMMMVVGVIMVVIVWVIMPLVVHGSPHPMVVVMDIPLMVIVVVNDQGARCALLVVMMVMGVMSMMMVVLMTMFMVMFMSMFVMMLMIVFMAGDPRLAASAYATHINLPRCR
ncbi:hypothetical protein [Aeromonas hydrophila]|uniref:hypothetical protein n=1 Tax=Aeromonas hydrophila TaxID=644 RepID=UPI001CCCA3AF|nr:hypothetical protein [Aeromonas hydrophila]MCR3949686.1 hypothetical protein [Aeromonas hydrophila]MCW4615635.1 hypothetical protein [Aeromonas hydrophila]UBQ50965.1 hypothetical protein LCH17_02200 [Aeromonas hydrophila]